MDIRNGAPAVGDNFFPRITIEAKLIRALKRDNVSFLGPRRTGKTSILMHLNNEPPDEFIPILLDLEKHSSVLGWLEAMFGRLKEELEGPNEHWRRAKHLRKGFGKFCEGLQEVKVAGTGFKFKDKAVDIWQPIADQFLDVLAQTDAPLLIMLDEFPWFLQFVAKKNSPAQAEEVLQWFRSARQKLAQANRQARFLVTGSIGLNAVVRRLGLTPSINDFDVVEIEPLSNDEALGLLTQLGEDNGVKLTDQDRNQLLELLGANWPILLQLFVLEIQDAEVESRFLSLNKIYETRLVAGARNRYCHSMFDRLAQVFQPSELRLAKTILKNLAECRTGLTSGDLGQIHEKLVTEPEMRGNDLEIVVDTLRHDGYVIQEMSGTGHWRFGSNILRDFWRRKTV